MNELIWIGSIVFYYVVVLILYRFMGVLGLLAWIPVATILANVEVLKIVALFGIPATTLGNIPYASTFLVTDILSENHGKVWAKKAVVLGFMAILVTMVAMNLALAYIPATDDWAHEHLAALFGFLPRLALASVLAYGTSQLHDVWLYERLKKWAPTRLWVRNNLSTLISQAIDTLVFCSVAFIGVYSVEVFWQIFISTYLFKAMAAIIDTPVLYLARRMHAKIPKLLTRQVSNSKQADSA